MKTEIWPGVPPYSVNDLPPIGFLALPFDPLGSFWVNSRRRREFAEQFLSERFGPPNTAAGALFLAFLAFLDLGGPSS